MKSSLSSSFQTRHNSLQNSKKSDFVLNQIDFSKVLCIVNAEKHPSFFSSSKKKKDFFETQGSQQNRLTQENSVTTNNLSTLHCNLVSSSAQNAYLSHLENNYSENKKEFRVKFPIKRDISKKKLKTKAQLTSQNKKSRGFVTSMQQLERALTSSTITSNLKSQIKQNNLKSVEQKESKKCLNFYTIDLMDGKNSKYRQTLIREIGRCQGEEYKIPKTVLINTVEQYLEMNKKKQPFKVNTNTIHKTGSIIKGKKKFSGKRFRLVGISRSKNHS